MTEFVDDDSAASSSEGISNYQLGFAVEGANELHDEDNWRDWDGGRIGGFPSWLDPVDLPTFGDICCTNCEEPMKFLLQIYCPLDDIPNAFHRSLYLFCCRKASCLSTSYCKSIKCFRSQLHRCNPYYKFDPESEGMVARAATNLCAMCGCRADPGITFDENNDKKNKTGDDVLNFCCAAHLERHKTSSKPPVYHEYELIVEQEVLENELPSGVQISTSSTTTIWDDAEHADAVVTSSSTAAARENDGNADLALEQSDYDSALGNEVKDPVYVDFLTRVSRSGTDQVLRYCRWDDKNGPLPISAKAKYEYQKQTCMNCGAPCKFEFQVMPQLLHYIHAEHETKVESPAMDEMRRRVALNESPPEDLKQVFRNEEDEDIDWGTLDIYTCTRSCGGTGGYLNEIVFLHKVHVRGD